MGLGFECRKSFHYGDDDGHGHGYLNGDGDNHDMI